MLGIGCPDRHALPDDSFTSDPQAMPPPPTAKPFRCVPGMLNSSEVKFLYPT